MFKELSELCAIYMRFFSIRGFFHSNRIEWMQYLNYYMPAFEPKFTENRSLTASSISRISESLLWLHVETKANNKYMYPVGYIPFFGYQFPSEDFCLFAKYPHRKIVLMSILGLLGKCSCTTLWIQKYMALYIQNQVKALSGFSACIASNYSEFERAYNACDMSSRIESCGTVSAISELKQSMEATRMATFSCTTYKTESNKLKSF